jgi:hypothetical protein
MSAAPAGAFAVDWSQTETDGERGRPVAEMTPGAEWRWHGTALRLDGPQDVCPLGRPLGRAALRDGARRRAARLAAMGRRGAAARAEPVPADLGGFCVTDGRRAWHAAWIDLGPGHAGLALFPEGVPPPDARHWIVSVPALRRVPRPEPAMLLPGLAEGARVATPGGACPVERLHPGARVLTRDAGPVEVTGVTQRRFSGARLLLDAGLRPLRPAVPGGGVRLSPAQRVLVTGPAALALFGTAEALVRAGDLDPPDMARDLAAAEVTYHAVALARPGLISAGGLWVEAVAGTADAPPRRVLSRAEAALLGARPRPGFGSLTSPGAGG